MPESILYMTAGCHLCEQAGQVIYAALNRSVTEIDIADDETLLERYGARIPVLRRVADGAELDWPFTVADARAFHAGAAAFKPLR